MLLCVALVTTLVTTTLTLELNDECAEYEIVERWNNGWKGHLYIPIPRDTRSWRISATFDNKILAGDFWAGEKRWSQDKLSVKVIGNDWSARQTAGSVFKTGFTVNYNEHGPEVNFKTLEITLCWLDGGCDTCSLFYQAAEECEGGFQVNGEDEEGVRGGEVRIMSTECSSTTPDITLTLSPPAPWLEPGPGYIANCSAEHCVLSSEMEVGINQLIQVPIRFPGISRVVGVNFRDQDLCNVEPVEEDLSLDPTREPDTTTDPITTVEPPVEGCAEYQVVERWNNGWKGHLYIPIPADTREWRLETVFTAPVVADFWAGLPEVWSEGHTRSVVLGRDWSAEQKAGTVFQTGFTANHPEGKQVWIKWMKLKLCWKDGGCSTCDIIKQKCTSLQVESSSLLASDTREGTFTKLIETCQNDMSPITLEFSKRVKRLIVGRGRYQAECSGYTCIVTSAKPIKLPKDTLLTVKFQAVFWSKPGKLVGINYGEEDMCHN